MYLDRGKKVKTELRKNCFLVAIVSTDYKNMINLDHLCPGQPLSLAQEEHP